MSLIMLYGLITLILGMATGCQLRIAWEQHVLNQVRRSHAAADNTSLYATMESALKTVEDSLNTIYPQHEKTCQCGYCEIKYGTQRTIAKRNQDSVYDPEYIRAVQAKNRELSREVTDLRTELERRDRAAAAAYPRLPPVQPGESFAIQHEDGTRRIVTRPKMADNQTQRPMVVNTPEWDETTQALMG